MINKNLLKAGVIVTTVINVGVSIAWLVKRIQYLREDVNYQLVERVHERLANAKKQLFQTYERRTTQENIHKAIVHVDGWDYLCDADAMVTKLTVSVELLNDMMMSDPDGKLAYMECRDILNECIDLINECEPDRYLIDDIADRIKNAIKGRKNKTLEDRLNEFKEKLDSEWYELNDEGVETALRPIYPWDSDWLPEEYASNKVNEFFEDGK